MMAIDHARALCLGVVVEAGLRFVSVATLSKWLGLSTSPRPATVAARAVPNVDAVVRITDEVLTLWPRRGRCVRRSLVLGALLRRHRPVLRIGVRKRNAALTAHAWVEIDGEPVGETAAGEFSALS